VALISDYLNDTLDAALLLSPDELRGRSRSASELIHNQRGHSFELALDLTVPSNLVHEGMSGDAINRFDDVRYRFDLARYELEIGTAQNGAAGVLAETLWLLDSRYRDKARPPTTASAIGAQPDEEAVPTTLRTRGATASVDGRLFRGDAPNGWLPIVMRDLSDVGSAIYTAERIRPNEDRRWMLAYRPAAGRSALSGLPDEPDRFPVASWVRDLLSNRVYRLALNAAAMRRPASPSAPRDFQPDGSNLPQMVVNIAAEDAQRYDDWLEHVRTILPGVDSVFVGRLPEDNRSFLQVKYHSSSVPIPAWLLSDGTLRLLALTLIPYLPGDPAIYLIEEPEDGLHPKAIEGVFQSLSSVYNGQVLVATHSPLFVGLANPAQLLCFARDSSGAVNVVAGDRHPALANWRGQVDLATLYASGVLG
jgi:hypothetical protein